MDRLLVRSHGSEEEICESRKQFRRKRLWRGITDHVKANLEREAEGETKGLTQDRKETGTQAWRTKVASYLAQLVVLAHTSITNTKDSSVARVSRKKSCPMTLDSSVTVLIIRSWLVSFD